MQCIVSEKHSGKVKGSPLKKSQSDRNKNLSHSLRQASGTNINNNRRSTLERTAA